MDSTFLARKFEAAVPYDRYVATGTPEQQRRWQQFHQTVRLTDAQRQLLGSFTRQTKVLVVSGIWCGDCVQQCPFLDHIAAANPAKLDVRFVDRDEHKDLSGHSRPTAATGCRSRCSWPRTSSCAARSATGRSRVPGAGPEAARGVVFDRLVRPRRRRGGRHAPGWVNEFERVQLMLRLSARLGRSTGIEEAVPGGRVGSSRGTRAVVPAAAHDAGLRR
jgi:thiol-disulfide isomerase/thioredoxin